MFWFTSDTHFGHENIIKYCNRPFSTITEMDSVIINNWNSRVEPEDTVYFLGDFCFKKSKEAPTGSVPNHYRNQLKGNITFLKGNHDCFSEQTRLLTLSGYKSYKELKVGEMIPTLNLDTLTVEYQPIQEIIINPVKEVYGFKTRSAEGEFSSNHKLLITWCNQRYSPMKLRKETCDRLWRRKSYFNIPSAIKSNLPNYDISDNWLRLLGWVYTDGGFDKKCNRVCIYQSKTQNLSIIRDLLNSLNIKYCETIRPIKPKVIMGVKVKSQLPAHVFYIPAKEGRIIKQKLNIIKKYDIPEWLNYLSDNQMNVLCNEMILGDGHTQNIGTRILWGNREFLSKIQGLFVTHGISCNLVTVKKKNWTYLSIHRNPLHIATKEINVKNCYIKQEESTTWCVTVKNHTLFTELNGKALISGNSNNGVKTILYRAEVQIGGHKILLLHDPKYYIEDNYSFVFCGHVHEKWQFKKIGKSVIINLSVDVWRFMPVNINEIFGRYNLWRKENI